MNSEKHSRGNVIVNAIAKFLKIGTHTKTKRKRITTSLPPPPSEPSVVVTMAMPAPARNAQMHDITTLSSSAAPSAQQATASVTPAVQNVSSQRQQSSPQTGARTLAQNRAQLPTQVAANAVSAQASAANRTPAAVLVPSSSVAPAPGSTSTSTPAPAAAPATGAVPVPASATSSAPISATPPKQTPKDYIFGKVIGEGSFSTVYLAKDVHRNKEYAIKVCDKRHIMREKKAEYVKREKEVLNVLNSNQNKTAPFFVKLYSTFQDLDRLYFVLSYAKNGELLPYINKVGSFDIACTRFYGAEILKALEHLHSLGIIHRDLKPENILLDERMHIQITDFGSAKILEQPRPEAGQQQQQPRQRRNSFVGTAQYVSPELLTEKSVSKSSDLWALGCIIYQMIAGLPPFVARSEYLIFQKIIKLEYEFPDGFEPKAKDFVQQLLVLDATSRLGAKDVGNYMSVRNHHFFSDIDFETLYKQTPPQIYPYLPGTSKNEEFTSHYRVPDHLEPGLDDKQLTRLLGLDLQDAEATEHARIRVQEPVKPKKKSSIIDLSPTEVNERLAKQARESKWHNLVQKNLILKSGLVDKRKGLFARRRMLFLTLGPHLYYVDPVDMVLKGEIPWSPELRVEPKNFKIFFVHTPNRTYYLEDPEGYALEWCKAIEEVRIHTYGLRP